MATTVDNNALASATDQLAFQRSIQRHTTGRVAIRWAAIICIAYIIEQGVVGLAGKSTAVIVSATLSLFADFKFSLAVTWAMGATGWAFLERWLRRRKAETMQGRIRELERVIDPNRTTSGLLPDGRTNPSDRLR